MPKQKRGEVWLVDHGWNFSRYRLGAVANHPYTDVQTNSLCYFRFRIGRVFVLHRRFDLRWE